MADTDSVIIKGIRGGLLLLLDDQEDYPALLAELRDRLGRREAFFRGASVTINLGRRAVAVDALADLRDVLRHFEIQVAALVTSNAESRTSAEALGLPSRPPVFARAPAPAAEPPPPPVVTPDHPGEPPAVAEPASPGIEAAPPIAGEAAAHSPDGDNAELDFTALAGLPDPGPPGGAEIFSIPSALFLRRTLRSGQSLQHDGPVCIIGDVNPGAEIIAGGDVIVWGSLRGVVHAGAGGDETAVVCALQLAPTLLRIGDIRARSPGYRPAGGVVIPEIAQAVAGRIVVEPWGGQRARR